MPEYALYLESGPLRRKTMVHVLDLLGCMVQGPTTEVAVEAAPDAIRTFLRFLKRHGEAVKPDASFTTKVAVHTTAGKWLGQGDPDGGFAADTLPLRAEDLKVYLKRLAWLRADLLEMVSGLSQKQMTAEPESGGRPVRRILEHIAGAHYAYLQGPLSKPQGLAGSLRAVEQSADIPAALTAFWELANTRLNAITEEERKAQVRHGVKIWTARRAMRRILEHEWEHFQEISRRLDGTA